MSESPQLPLGVYRFHYQALDALAFPDQPGVLWHSVLGAALHSMVCVVPGTACASCLFQHQCDYTQLFCGTKPPGSEIMRRYTTIPTPHVFQVPVGQARVCKAGDAVEVGVVLAGQANARLPVLTGAMHRAGMKGLGKGRARLRLLRVAQCLPDGRVLSLLADEQRSEPAPAQVFLVPECPDDVVVRFLTPYRPSGAAGRAQTVDIGHWLMAIIRRVDLLQYFTTGEKLAADFPYLKQLTLQVRVLEMALQFRFGQRYSAAERVDKNTGGFVGELRLDLRGCEALWPFLWAAQWLNVGKSASMGYGHYTLA